MLHCPAAFAPRYLALAASKVAARALLGLRAQSLATKSVDEADGAFLPGPAQFTGDVQCLKALAGWEQDLVCVVAIVLDAEVLTNSLTIRQRRGTNPPVDSSQLQIAVQLRLRCSRAGHSQPALPRSLQELLLWCEL